MKDTQLNIAIFTPSQNPYSETFIQAHKNYLKGNIFYYYGSGSNIQLEGTKSLLPELRRKFIKIIQLVFKKKKSFLIENQLQYSLKKNQIDVILIEYGTHANNLLPFLKKLKIPFVVHFHGYDASKYKALEKTNNYKELFKEATQLIAVSKKMEAMLLDIGCPKEKLVYNVYGSQPEFEKIQATFSKKQFIAIGRFTDKKAPYYTILAFKKVLEKHSDAKLLMAGDGVLLNTCINLIKHYQLENNIKLLGIITLEEYRNYLSESLAFVQHSIRAEDGDMEGTPLAILEASSAGLPVISTFHAGIPDVIINGTTGLLCKEHDVETMANNMLQLLENKELAITMGKAGKKNSKDNFSLKRHIDVLQEIITKAI